MELDLQSLFGSCVTCTHWLRLRNSPPPSAFGLIYEGGIGQPRETTSLYNPLFKTKRFGTPSGPAKDFYTMHEVCRNLMVWRFPRDIVLLFETKKCRAVFQNSTRFCQICLQTICKYTSWGTSGVPTQKNN
jgi:hypothetical protein